MNYLLYQYYIEDMNQSNSLLQYRINMTQETSSHSIIFYDQNGEITKHLLVAFPEIIIYKEVIYVRKFFGGADSIVLSTGMIDPKHIYYKEAAGILKLQE